MENLMKKFFRSSIVTSIFLIILGGLLIFKSGETIVTISYIIGGILMALGVLALIRFVREARHNTSSELDIIYGIVTIILGYLVISNPTYLGSIIPIVLGVSIIISSATKLQYALELRKDKNKIWKATLITALISAICGAALIFNPFKGAKMITQIVGIFIIIYAALDISSTIAIKRNVTAITKAIKEAEIVEEKEE